MPEMTCALPLPGFDSTAPETEALPSFVGELQEALSLLLPTARKFLEAAGAFEAARKAAQQAAWGESYGIGATPPVSEIRESAGYLMAAFFDKAAKVLGNDDLPAVFSDAHREGAIAAGGLGRRIDTKNFASISSLGSFPAAFRYLAAIYTPEVSANAAARATAKAIWDGFNLSSCPPVVRSYGLVLEETIYWDRSFGGWNGADSVIYQRLDSILSFLTIHDLEPATHVFKNDINYLVSWMRRVRVSDRWKPVQIGSGHLISVRLFKEKVQVVIAREAADQFMAFISEYAKG